MANPAPGVAMPEEQIDWLDGSSPDLTEREQLLWRNARAEGYAEGERRGYKVGGEDAVRAMTTLATLMNDERFQRAIQTLAYFQEQH